jgi:hypothetical protein
VITIPDTVSSTLAANGASPRSGSD